MIANCLSRLVCAVHIICYNIGMDKETLIERLRNPQKFQKKPVTPTTPKSQETTTPQAQKPREQKPRITAIVGGGVLFLIFISLVFIFSAQRKAENIPAFLDKSVLKGLVVDKTFAPTTGKRYVQVSEGADRNVVGQSLGATLPVISRFNFRALTENNYQVIGTAPFALTININANIEDPEMLRYLFNQDTMIKSFLARTQVAQVLENPTELARLAGDENLLREFFTQEPMERVLASEEAVNALAGSRFMAYLLISKSVKYYRDRPEEAAKLIAASPTLSAIKKNEFVRKAVTENVYLQKIAPTLLK